MPIRRYPFALLAATLALALGGCASDDGAGAAADPEPPALPALVTVAEGGTVPHALDDVIADMAGAHEGFPRGVITDGGAAWEWVYRPRVGYGNDLPAGWDATIPWGQVYADSLGGRTAQARFQIRNLRQYMLSRADSTWRLIAAEDDDIAGANYAEDFQNDANVPAGLRREASGGISAAVADGYNFHFFARNRVRVDPDDVGGMYTVFEARLLPGTRIEPGGSSHLLADAGGDYWLDTAAAWDQWTTNGDWAIGRFKYLTPDWRHFSAHTLDAATLRRYPPPGLE